MCRVSLRAVNDLISGLDAMVIVKAIICLSASMPSHHLHAMIPSSACHALCRQRKASHQPQSGMVWVTHHSRSTPTHMYAHMHVHVPSCMHSQNTHIYTGFIHWGWGWGGVKGKLPPPHSHTHIHTHTYTHTLRHPHTQTPTDTQSTHPLTNKQTHTHTHTPQRLSSVLQVPSV